MDVNAIRDRVLELSHSSAGVDSDLQGKALGWINSAYHEVMDEVLPYLPQALQVQESVTANTGGVATLSRGVYRLIRVVDAVNGRMLSATTPVEILDIDPAGNAVGDPVRGYAKDNTVVIHPAKEISLKVLYVPVVTDLVAGGAEADVLLPRAFHHALVWGGLVWSALFERGFFSQSELLMYQRQWLSAKEGVKLSLLGNTGETLRVKPFNWV